MRPTTFDFLGNLDTLLAVFLGAILATGGALVAELVQEKRNRKRKERDAARFVGDILMTIDQILDFAINSQTIGDKWGKTSIRLYQTALREAAVYERNRERLFDIFDMKLRNRIHTHFLRETFPIEAMLETCDEVIQTEKTIEDLKSTSNKEQKILSLRLNEIIEARETALNALVREKEKTADLCQELSKTAKVNFDEMHEDISNV